jgi:putative CocE/NonD family hydrolase
VIATGCQTLSIELDVPVPMRDGTILRANVYRPAGQGRWPVLLTRLPYGKDLPPGTAAQDPVQAVRRGYVVIVQDTRGCGISGGEWYPFRYEADDGADTVAWAADLPYADGRVGMYGASYFGFTQWAAASQQPPALRAMAPRVTWTDPLNGLLYRGGAFELGTAGSWNLQTGLNVVFRRHAGSPQMLGAAIQAWADEVDGLGATGYWSLPLRDFGPFRREDVAPFFFDAVEAATDRTRGPAADTPVTDWLDRVDVPTLNIGGWFDLFLYGTLDAYQSMRQRGRPTRLLIGPWSHDSGLNPIGERSFGFAAQPGFINLEMNLDALQLRWFDHWLRGVDTGMMDEPPVRIFVMGANLWRYEEDWPLSRAVPTPWYLHSNGVLSEQTPDSERPDCYDYDPADPVPTRGGALLMTPEFPGGAFDQRSVEARPDVLVYRSAPLERDVEVTGPITVRLWAISSSPDTDFVARLVDVFPDGRSFNLTDGIVRARYRDAAKGVEPSLIEPGQPLEYEIDLWATSNLFQARHRIGLQVTSSCFPRWDRNPNTGHPFGADAELQVAHQRILHDREHPSHVLLPIVPA